VVAALGLCFARVRVEKMPPCFGWDFVERVSPARVRDSPVAAPQEFQRESHDAPHDARTAEAEEPWLLLVSFAWPDDESREAVVAERKNALVLHPAHLMAVANSEQALTPP
jgi:hypothetical protein